MFVPRNYIEKEASSKAFSTKEEIQDRKKAGYRFFDADVNVRNLLRTCVERRAIERPLPSRISWENRPKWNSKIVNLTPVVGDPPVAPIA